MNRKVNRFETCQEILECLINYFTFVVQIYVKSGMQVHGLSLLTLKKKKKKKKKKEKRMNIEAILVTLKIEYR